MTPTPFRIVYFGNCFIISKAWIDNVSIGLILSQHWPEIRNSSLKKKSFIEKILIQNTLNRIMFDVPSRVTCRTTLTFLFTSNLIQETCFALSGKTL